MWANGIFSLEEKRAYLPPRVATPPPPIFPAYNHNSSSANSRKTWAPSSSYGPDYHSYPNTHFGSSLNRPPPQSGHPPKAAASAQHRVMAFPTSGSWTAYFVASKNNKKLVVIDFTATWCGPCRKMEPVIEEFAAKYTDVDFAKIDVDKLFDVSCEYGVQTMPTFLLMKDGKVLDRVTGARRDDLQRKIEIYRA